MARREGAFLIRLAVSVLFIIHGIAHLPGFTVPWRLTTSGDMPFKTTMLGGSVDLGLAGIRLVGVLWLLTGLCFIVTGVLALRNYPSWPTLAVIVTLCSLGLTIVGWPEARIGLLLNILLLAFLVIARSAGWLPRAT